ncbi:helix-turn-helix domain-containing protein [uncultured Dysosmobacter sp.]|uniref:helix-turn-helix domain-containing protein n=1 Tax=uncultured Dysosmobacter sp. TaxID=2591384 RepID=UPI002618E51C|nr:helix-turn-helix domain-containing protein [uncultured Dysosmobacter sp.]
MRIEKVRCGSCIYGAGPLNIFRCNYAGLTGRTRKGQPPENCTYFRPGRRLETPEEAARWQKARQKEAKRRRNSPDWEKGGDLYRQGQNDGEIARALGCSRGAVLQWRRRNGLRANAGPVNREGWHGDQHQESTAVHGEFFIHPG